MGEVSRAGASAHHRWHYLESFVSTLCAASIALGCPCPGLGVITEVVRADPPGSGDGARAHGELSAAVRR